MMDAVFPPNYPEARLARMLFGLDQKRYSSESRARAKRSLSSILSRLKDEGLVQRTGPKKKSVWQITPKGRFYLQRVKPRQKRPPPIACATLPPTDGIIRLVSFDIPEKDRWKRKWLRTQLIAYGYAMLHKSVFTGKRPLPHEFIQAIDGLRLGAQIHIVGITKSGTLTKDIK